MSQCHLYVKAISIIFEAFFRFFSNQTVLAVINYQAGNTKNTLQNFSQFANFKWFSLPKYFINTFMMEVPIT